MAKLLHILISLAFLTANVAAALPSCESEKSDLSCMQTHSDKAQLEQSASNVKDDDAGTQTAADQLHKECCSCDHPAVCLGCCHSHTYLNARVQESLSRQIDFQLLIGFFCNSAHSTQPEADIDRPPIANAVA